MIGGRRILIVGGGIAGLALARMLARSGVSPEVIEREPLWRPAGTGMYLPGNAARALRALGLEAQVASRAVEIPRQRFADHRGRLLCEVDVAELWRPVGPCLAIHRADLHELLLEAAGDVPIRLGLAVDRLAHQDQIVSVALSDGTRGDYDLVVGADGIHSTVRALTFEPAAVPRPVGQVGWRFLAPRPPEIATWSVMLGRRTAFLTLPIGGDRVYCYCDVVSSRAPDSTKYGPAERLRQLFGEFADPAATLLDAVEDIHVSTIEEVALDSWVRERVVLIGDAAHATSPNMAQGAAMALEDALVLTDCLHRIPAIPDALAAFQSRRRPRTDWVRAQTHRRDHTRYLPPAVRDNVLWVRRGRVSARRLPRSPLALRSPRTLGRVALVAAPVEERSEGARKHRDGGNRVRLEKDVKHARRRRDWVAELGRDRQELCARPEQGISRRRYLGAGRVSLEEKDQHGRHSVQADRHDEEK